jgi:hypothetical protein
MAPASNSAASAKEREEEQPTESKSDDSGHKLIKAKLEEELTTQSIKRSLQALVQPLFPGLGIQAAFLRAFLSFGRFGLQSSDFVAQLSDLSLQPRILSSKIVKLRFQGSLVGGSLSPNP